MLRRISSIRMPTQSCGRGTVIIIILLVVVVIVIVVINGYKLLVLILWYNLMQ